MNPWIDLLIESVNCSDPPREDNPIESRDSTTNTCDCDFLYTDGGWRVGVVGEAALGFAAVLHESGGLCANVFNVATHWLRKQYYHRFSHAYTKGLLWSVQIESLNCLPVKLVASPRQKSGSILPFGSRLGLNAFVAINVYNMRGIRCELLERL